MLVDLGNAKRRQDSFVESHALGVVPGAKINMVEDRSDQLGRIFLADGVVWPACP